MATEYIEVRITASQTVQYAQTVNMSVGDYEKYQKLVAADARDSEFDEIAELYLDLADVWHADRLQEVEVRLWTPDQHS